MAEKILFVCGSLNQTTQMHQIARNMDGYTCHFTPYFADGFVQLAANAGWLDSTVLGGRHRRETCQYLADHRLAIDERGAGHSYDLVVTCSDLMVQKNIRHKRTILIQEGITEPEGKLYRLYKLFPFLPRYIANTATNGLSNEYDLFCVASNGYADHFIRKGVSPKKIAVTGIPNFDNLQQHLNNSFPEHGFVLVATTPFRETFRRDDRMAFLRRCGEIAAGRPMIFKLHPSEISRRATREIHSLFPAATVLTHGSVNDMIANASTVITQQSTCTFVALALGKETHSFLNLAELRRLMPIQNGGASAHQIAGIAHRLLHTSMPVLEQVRKGYQTRPLWEQA